MMHQIKITNRERQVLELISLSQTTNEIAQTLKISAHTVLSHRKRLLVKLDVSNAAGLVRKGYEFGILKLMVA